MIFSRIFADMNNENIPDEKELSDLCRQNTKAIYSESGEKCMAVINEVTGTHCEIIAAVKADAVDLCTADAVTDMVSRLYGWQLTLVRTEELVFYDFKSLLKSAERNGYINSCNRILSEFDISPHGYYGRCQEYIARSVSHDEIRNMSQNLLYENSFIPELERIYKQRNTSAKLFHPVHYIIKSDSKEDSHEMIDGIISALYEKYAPDYIIRLEFEDIAPDELYDEGINPDHIFNDEQAREIAEFIYKVKDKTDTIICQCEYGQSRSAGCAAAIREHFHGDGIDIFADDRYYPNKLVFRKVLKALNELSK